MALSPYLTQSYWLCRGRNNIDQRSHKTKH